MTEMSETVSQVSAPSLFCKVLSHSNELTFSTGRHYKTKTVIGRAIRVREFRRTSEQEIERVKQVIQGSPEQKLKRQVQ